MIVLKTRRMLFPEGLNESMDCQAEAQDQPKGRLIVMHEVKIERDSKRESQSMTDY